MKVNVIKELLKREIDFKKAARKIREFQIEDSENAWELFYDTHENDPELHYGPHVEKLVEAGEDHDSLCDAFDAIFTDLLTEALKKVQLKVIEEVVEKVNNHLLSKVYVIDTIDDNVYDQAHCLADPIEMVQIIWWQADRIKALTSARVTTLESANCNLQREIDFLRNKEN